MINNDHLIDVQLAGIPFQFMIDSGAGVNTITSKMHKILLKNHKDKLINWSRRSDRILRGYASDKPLEVEATFYVNTYIDEFRPKGKEKFYVIKDSPRALLSRSTALRYNVLLLGVNVPLPNAKNPAIIDHLYAIEENNLDQTTSSKIFPKFMMPPVKIKLDLTVEPRRCSYTNIPFAWRAAAKNRLREMEEAGIIERVTGDMDRSHCSALLAVPKGISDFRLVVDLRGPNECVIREPHKMPTLDSILARLADSIWFSTIDLSNAFFHVELAEESRHITNFYTGDSYYRYTRLPFGLCNAPDIFQSTLELILADIDGIMIYLDDILIFAKEKSTHDEILGKVFRALKAHGVRLNKEKCQLGKREVKFLGFIIKKDGYSVTPDRLSSIRNFRTPRCISEIRSFLGMLIFVDRFIFDRTDKTKVLQQMVRDQRFSWSAREQNEFDNLRKEVLTEIKKLGFFKQGDRTELIVDASPIGLGAVLTQFDDHNKARIIACASKSLSSAERKYPQVQREALAIVWGVERFQLFLRGQKFTVKTDSEGNQFIFGSSHKMGRRCISRAEAWALRLQPFNFKIERVPGHDNIADVFSRLIDESQDFEPFEDFDDNHVLMVDSITDLPVTASEVAIASESDEEIQRVFEALESGVWTDANTALNKEKKNLHAEGGILFFRSKMVIPATIRERTLRHAHVGHFGMGSMKRMLRQHVWWPNINRQVESLVSGCEICQQIVHTSRPVPYSSRYLTDEPWQRIQIDFLTVTGCGSGELLMVVDTHSRMTWAIEMAKLDSATTIKALQRIFAIWGNPIVIQSDNGPPFNSAAFTQHWKDHGVRHLNTIPNSPWTNGMVERSNEGVKKTLTAALIEGKNWRTALQDYLSRYNNAIPHSSTGATPFELMTGRLFRGIFPFPYTATSRSNISKEQVRANDETAKVKSISRANLKRRAKPSEIREGDWVWVSNKYRRSKMESFYLNEKFKVIDIDGHKVSVESQDGKVSTKYLSDLKKTSNPDKQLEIGNEVTHSFRRREIIDPSAYPSTRFKVLSENEGNLTLRSENGETRFCTTNEAQRIDKFSWNQYSQAADPESIISNEVKDTPGSDVSGDRPQMARAKRETKLPVKLRDYEMFNIFN